MRFDYRGTTPMTMWVSPELGVLDDEARRPTADRLLAARSRQVFELLKENIALRVRRGLAPGRRRDSFRSKFQTSIPDRWDLESESESSPEEPNHEGRDPGGRASARPRPPRGSW